MMLLSRSQLVAIVLSSVSVSALNVYDQCGGIGWSGSGTCPSGTTCVYSNPYYSQCQPGSAEPATTATTTTVSVPQTTTTLRTSTTSSSSALPAATGTKYIFSFGDSYTDTGFRIAGTKPSASNPLGNPGYPGSTTSGGVNWIDLLTKQYNTALTLTYNFAWGGATTNAALVAPYANTVLSLIDQVKLFSNNVASKPSYAPWTSSNALFSTWIGINDIGMSWYTSNYNNLVPQIMSSYFAQQQILYNAGARKFLFINVPPVQLTPREAAGGASSQSNEAAAIATYNNALTKAIADFKAKNAGITVYVYDSQPVFLKAFNNPTAYGAPNNSCYDAGGTKCLWWNNYHPGVAIQTLVAQGVAALIGNW